MNTDRDGKESSWLFSALCCYLFDNLDAPEVCGKSGAMPPLPSQL